VNDEASGDSHRDPSGCFEKTGEFAKLFEIVREKGEKAKFSQTSVEIYPNFPKRGSNLSKLVEIFRMARMARIFSPNARTTISRQTNDGHTNRARRGFGQTALAARTLDLL